jgi:hypothetical protein
MAQADAKQLRGYRLHDERIDFSGGAKSIRAIKVELLNLESTKEDKQRGVKKNKRLGSGLQGQLADAVFLDYRDLFGPTSFEDYLVAHQSTSEQWPTSFMELWVEAVCQGVIMSNKVVSEFGELRGGSAVGRIFAAIPEELRRQLDKDQWIAWFDKGIRSTSTASSRLTAFRSVFTSGKVPDDVLSVWQAKEAEVADSGEVAALGRSDFKKVLFAVLPKMPDRGVDAPKKSAQALQWAIDPEFAPVDSSDRTKAMDKVMGQWRDRLVSHANADDLMKRFMGIGDNGNHLSNGLFGSFFTELRDSDPAELAGRIGRTYSFSTADTANVADRIKALKAVAARLPLRPAVIDKWSEYRVDMNAKLESWLSNHQTKGAKAISDLWGEAENAAPGGLLSTLDKLRSNEIIAQDIREGILADTVEFIGERREFVDRTFCDELESYLRDLRGELNRWRQGQAAAWEAAPASQGARQQGRRPPVNPWETHSTKPDPLVKVIKDDIPQKVQRSPLFWGEDKQALWQQVIDAKRLIVGVEDADWRTATGLAALQGALRFITDRLPGDAQLNESLSAPARGSYRVDGLAQLWVRLHLGSDKSELSEQGTPEDGPTLAQRPRAYGNPDVMPVVNPLVESRLRAIQEALGVDFDRRTRRYRFYLSGRERDSVSLVPQTPHRITVKHLLDLADLGALYSAAARTPERDWLLRDTIQLSKLVLPESLRVIRAEIPEGRGDEIRLTAIHSDLQGLASHLAKTCFISRAAVQATNGNQSLLGVDLATASSWSASPSLSKGDRTASRFYYVFPKADVPAGGALGQPMNIWVAKQGNLKGSGEGGAGGKKVEVGQSMGKSSVAHTLAVATSRYQLQFFDWWAGRHSQKKTTLEVMGAFTIAEREIQLDWSGSEPVIINAPNREDHKQSRLFVSQPFQLVPQARCRTVPTAHRSIRLMGVDVGEYGLAWSVWEFDHGFVDNPSGRSRCLGSGVMAQAGQRKIRKSVNQRRMGQAVRTFTSPDTYVARLREAVINAYQAELEATALAYGARLVFEKDISSFETGSEQVKRIYASVKRSSVMPKKAAEDLDAKQHWGVVRGGEEQRSPWGREVSAWMTSQTCTACGRTFALAYRTRSGNGGDPDCAGEVRFLRKVPGSSSEICARKIDTNTVWESDAKRAEFERSVYALMRPALYMGTVGDVTVGGNIILSRVASGALDDERGFGRLMFNAPELAAKGGRTRHQRQPVSSEADLKLYEEQRGHSAIFLCPYTDCSHVADADLQASYNIALRGFAAVTMDQLPGFKGASNAVKEKRSAWERDFMAQWRRSLWADASSA